MGGVSLALPLALLVVLSAAAAAPQVRRSHRHLCSAHYSVNCAPLSQVKLVNLISGFDSLPSLRNLVRNGFYGLPKI